MNTKFASGFQAPITIANIIESIHERTYVLPAIQREFVWETEQIIKLFDSLMQGYPIGSLLFWFVGKEKIKDFQFYEFIRDYHEKNNKHNQKANTIGEESTTAVLDGQQRLTSLYIALKGSYAEKIPNKRWSKSETFQNKKLYLNLLKPPSDDQEIKYNFSFLAIQEFAENDKNNYWFEVGKILEFKKLFDVNQFLKKAGLVDNEFANDCLSTLYEIVMENPVINFYLETSDEIDKVVQLFIRVNSGGTKLSYSDMLLSIATTEGI